MARFTVHCRSFYWERSWSVGGFEDVQGFGVDRAPEHFATALRQRPAENGRAISTVEAQRKAENGTAVAVSLVES